MVEGADHQPGPRGRCRDAALGTVRRGPAGGDRQPPVGGRLPAPLLAQGDAPLIFVSGGSPLRARAGAEQLRDSGASALVSFGLAVGLAPVLRPGDVVLADTVVLPGGRSMPTDPGWRAALLQRLGGSGINVRVARIAGSDELPTSASAKRRVFQMTFAAALDTDSHVVAEVAAAAGLPLLVVRAVAEPAEEMRPAVAFAATRRRRSAAQPCRGRSSGDATVGDSRRLALLQERQTGARTPCGGSSRSAPIRLRLAPSEDCAGQAPVTRLPSAKAPRSSEAWR